MSRSSRQKTPSSRKSGSTPETRTGIVFSGEERVMGLLLLFVPATLIAAKVNVPPAIQFFLAVASVIPCAAFIGAATEALADRLGGKIGGLLNATFGNSPDLLIGIFGVQKGLIPLVKATLIGALISNSALIMGLCYITAGLLYGRPRFKRDEAGHHSVLMMLAVAAILFPSIGATTLCGGATTCGGQNSATIMHVSVGISVFLLLAYFAYVVYGIFGVESLKRTREPGRETHVMKERLAEEKHNAWPAWFALLVLGLTTAGLIPVVDILTGSVQPVTQVLGWTQVFVGIIVVANAGNVAEAYAAIKFAIQRPATPETSPSGDSGLDLALGIASASSIQIATFVAPVVVLYSLFSHSMSLAFSPIEIAILALLVIIFAYIAHDGESNWLEGFQLVTLYGMAAVVFFTLPDSAFGQ